MLLFFLLSGLFLTCFFLLPLDHHNSLLSSGILSKKCYMPVCELRSTSFSVIPVTSPSILSCLCHSCHFSITAVSLFYVPFIIVFYHLSVFRPSSIPSLRIYSTPFMFRASFLGFVATLSYFNIFTFLWLDNKFIVFVIL